VLDWPPPQTVRAFLGLAWYYRCFIQDYSMISAPLTSLLRKEAFRWGPEAEAGFHALQRTLTAALVLQLPDFDCGFIIECDASGVGISVVLHQGQGLITFFSKQLATRHASLAAYEHELISLVLAVRHWRPYLWDRLFIIKTDHYSVKFLLD
jgi:hypothetical protein